MVNFCESQKCLSGKTAIVTGANAGLGFETALEFARRSCYVILACRNEEKASKARDKIITITGNQNVVVKIVDLASLESVRQFATHINTTEPRLDLLVNNAGVAMLPDQTTPDGLQVEMTINYFSHFLLTNLLLDLLKKSAPSRVINLSSNAAKLVWNLNLEELNKHNGNIRFYCKTKLCNILFTQELARRLEGTGVTTYSLHPGAVHTEAQGFSKVFDYFASKFFKTPHEGVQTALHVALVDGIEECSGQHFEDCRPVRPYRGARDEKKAKELWEVSEKMVGLK